MNKSELSELDRRLQELADALGGRAPGAKGILVWLDALGECTMDDIKLALSDWPKKNIKMPAPADILKICRELAAVRREQQARAYRESAPRFDDVMEAAVRGAVSVDAKAEIAKMLKILRSPKPGPKDWAYRLKAMEEAGEHLDFQQRRLWREALRIGQAA